MIKNINIKLKVTYILKTILSIIFQVFLGQILIAGLLFIVVLLQIHKDPSLLTTGDLVTSTPKEIQEFCVTILSTCLTMSIFTRFVIFVFFEICKPKKKK